jgi:aspartate racemase
VVDQVLLIGLLGGMSWQSSAIYYQLLNELVENRQKGLHSARCVLYSVDFAEIERMQSEDRWDEAAAVLAKAAQALELAGADFIVLCTNTMHKVAAQIEAAVSVPLLHLIDTTANAVLRSNLRKVGLLGTRFTMQQSFYRDRFLAHGIEVVLPSASDQDVVSAIIYDELCRGIVRDASRRTYREIIHRLVADAVEGVIYGCTEIEMLVSQKDSPVPVFPTTRIHCEAAVEIAFGVEPLLARP